MVFSKFLFPGAINSISRQGHYFFEFYYIEDFIRDLKSIVAEDNIAAVRCYDVDDCFHLKINKEIGGDNYLLEVKSAQNEYCNSDVFYGGITIVERLLVFLERLKNEFEAAI